MHKTEQNFGSGSFVGDIMQPTADFFDLNAADQARYLGWVAACPVVEELIGPDNPAPGRGAEAMAKRYGAVAFWHGFIAREIADENFALSVKLMDGAAREPDEPVGRYEPQSVPEGYEEEYSAVGKLVGFALPRMFIDHIAVGGTEQERASRLASGIRIIQDAASWAKLSEEEFLARTAEGLAREGTPPERLLKHIAGQGWLDEHNGRRTFNRAMLQVREHAPLVWGVYETMSEERREQQKLAEFDPLDVEYEPTQAELRELFDGLSAGVKKSVHTRPSSIDIRQMNEFKRDTKVLLNDDEASFVMHDHGVHGVEVSLVEPTDKNYKEWSLQTTAYYGRPGVPGESSVIQSWTLFKSISMSRGDEYSLQKFPTEMLTNPDDEGVSENVGVSNGTGDLDEEFYEDNARLNLDDVAMLNRLKQALHS